MESNPNQNQNTDKGLPASTKPMEPQLISYLFSKASHFRKPISGTFELTPRCNFNCKMCYVHLSKEEQEARGRELTAKEWIALGEECAKEGMLFLLLTGGEPLLRSDFKEIYLGLKKLGLFISINTNGSLIDDEMFAFFKENPPYKFNITLYGSSREVYQRINGNPSAFDKTINAIRRLKEGNFNVKMNCSITPYNRDDIDNIVAIAQELKLHCQYAEYMFPPLRVSADKIGTGNRMSAKDAGLEGFRCLRRRYPDEEQYLYHLRSTALGIKVVDPTDECLDVPTVETADATERIRCRAGTCAFWISWDGKITPCGMMTEPVADVTEIGFSEAWKRIHTATDGIMMAPKCTNCDKRFACTVCAASTYCETGSYGKDEPKYMCEMTGEYLRLVKAEYERLLAAGTYDKYLNPDKK